MARNLRSGVQGNSSSVIQCGDMLLAFHALEASNYTFGEKTFVEQHCDHE